MKTYLFKLSVLSSALLSCAVFAKTEQMLPTIEITAKNGVQTKTDVVTTEKINKSTETDLRGLLTDEPSISFGGGNGTSQRLALRGIGQDHINMVVDGSSIDAQIYHHQGRFMLDPSLIKIVKVQKGTGSASSGIGANNGAIVARTVDALDLLADGQNYGSKIHGNYASNKEHSYGASVFARAGQFDFLVGGNWVDQSNYESGKKDGGHYKAQNSALDKRGLLAKAGFNINDDHRVVLGYRQELNKGIRNIKEEFDTRQEDLDSTRDDPRYREIEMEQTTLEWKGRNLGFVDRIESDIAYIKNIRTDGERQPPVAEEAGIKTTTGIKAIAANVNLESQITDDSVLKYGVNYRKQKAYYTGEKSQEKTDVGAYIESVNKINNFILTGGLRYDSFDLSTENDLPNPPGYKPVDPKKASKTLSGHDLNPSLALSWQVIPSLNLNVSHSYATRSPRFGDSSLAGRRKFVIANGTVAERTRNTELGFNYENGAFRLDGNYFWTTTRHIGGMEKEFITEFGTLKNKGYELSTAYRWNGLKFQAGVAYSEPRLNGKVEDYVLRAMPIGRTWTSGLSYTFDNPSLEIGWKGRLVQKNSYENDKGVLVERAGYNVHDIYANWQPLHNDRLNVNFAINNVADKYYKPHGQRPTINALPAAGRDFRIGFNYTF